MSILSKTLQKLLYKYLSDVDVEGVALPSLYENGWGVRLSNVKLREGIKLLDLPGRFRKQPNPSKKQRSTPETVSTEKTKQGEETETPATTDANQRYETVVVDSDDDEDVPQQRSWLGRLYCRSSSVHSRQSTASAQPLPEKEVPPPAHKEHGSEPLPLNASEEPDQLHGVAEAMGDTLEQSESFALPDEVEADHEERSHPVILRLGKEGRIGVLDVRLVGKSIRVLVEDASLTVEVVRASALPKRDEDASPRPDSRKSTSKASKESTTVGERVLAENALARIFSAMPNLFLRDIRVRVIIRSELIVSSTNPEDENVSDEIEPNDSVLDFSIEMLSVTDGEDFLANFRAAADVDSVSEEDNASDADHGEAEDVLKGLSSGGDSSNDFEIKRIRTGRGTEGGITLRCYSGSDIKHFDRAYDRKKPMWARQSFLLQSNFYSLRLSGLDIETRVFLGESSKMVAAADVYLDDFGIDPMFFGGVDYVAPGPQNPLPPMANDRGVDDDDDDKTWTLPGATTYATDANGIQRCGVRSNFHRVARGMKPVPGTGDHLPCENHSNGWFDAHEGLPKKHFLDNSLPMGGFVMHASTRDPLELNIDGHFLDTLGILMGVFKKETPPPATIEADLETCDEKANANSKSREISETTDIWDGDASTRSFISRSSSLHDDSVRGSQRRRVTKHVEESSRALTAPTASLTEMDDNIDSSFPAYMQPEKVQLLGLHLSDVRLRIHELGENGNDRRLGFRYWDLSVSCLTSDVQLLSSPENPFQDIRLDVGHLSLSESRGTTKTSLASFGIQHEKVDLDEVTVDTLLSKDPDNLRPPWPSTAAALLDLPPPLETLLYESRDKHALQLRFCRVSKPGTVHISSFGSLDAVLGKCSVDAQYGFHQRVSSVICRAKSAVLGDEPERHPTDNAYTYSSGSMAVVGDKPAQSGIRYKVRLGGGKIRMDPVFDISLPSTALTGDWSSVDGVSLEAFLHLAHVKYSKPAKWPTCQRGLSLSRMADVPDNVRLRILLFLSDLKPLESALGLKPEPNSFMRCRAVNKGIVKIARRLERRSKKEFSKTTRRQELMQDLAKLTDRQLEELLALQAQQQNKTRPQQPMVAT